jgi:TolA-binding protein
MTSATTYKRCKMNCSRLERDDLFLQYLAGSLESGIESEFEDHIIRCKPCQRVLETLLLAREDLEARAHIIRTHHQPSRIWSRWVLAVVSSSCLLLLGIAMFWFPGKQGPEPAVSKGGGTEKQAAASTAENADDRSRVEPPSIPHSPEISPELNERTKDSTALAGNPEAGQQTSESEPGPLPPSYKGSQTKRSNPNQEAEPAEVVWSQAQLSAIETLSKIVLPKYTFSGLAKPRRSGGAGFPTGVVNLPQSGGSQALGTAADLFQDAMLAYVEKRYSDAEALLEAAVKVAPGAPEANFYLGISRLALGRPSEAVGPLRSVLASQDSLYAQQAHFYLAKAYMRVLRLPEADEQLEKAASMPGPLRTDAQSELTNLRAILAISNASQKIGGPDKTH